MDADERDYDLLAEMAEDRLRRRHERAMRGTWDQPGECLDSAHEEAATAEEESP